jgi:hypothetical protein
LFPEFSVRSSQQKTQKSKNSQANKISVNITYIWPLKQSRLFNCLRNLKSSMLNLKRNRTGHRTICTLLNCKRIDYTSDEHHYHLLIFPPWWVILWQSLLLHYLPINSSLVFLTILAHYHLYVLPPLVSQLVIYSTSSYLKLSKESYCPPWVMTVHTTERLTKYNKTMPLVFWNFSSCLGVFITKLQSH